MYDLAKFQKPDMSELKTIPKPKFYNSEKTRNLKISNLDENVDKDYVIFYAFIVV